MRNPILTFVLGLVLGLVVAGGTFFLGMNQGQAQAQDQRTAFLQSRGVDPATAGGAGGFAGGFGGTGGTGATGAGAGRAGGGTVGRISKIDGNTITITSQRDGDLTVTLPANPTIFKQAEGTISDLQTGDQITVQGTRSGTNIAATRVQVVPNFAPVPSPTP